MKSVLIAEAILAYIGLLCLMLATCLYNRAWFKFIVMSMILSFALTMILTWVAGTSFQKDDPDIIALSVGFEALALATFGAGTTAFVRQIRRRSRKAVTLTPNI